MQTPTVLDYPAVRLIGMRWQPQDPGTIGELWQRFLLREGEIQPLAPMGGGFGVCEPLAAGGWRYLAARPVTPETPVPAGMHALTLPAGRYAVLEHRGTVDSLPDSFRAAYGEWLPAAGLKPAEGMAFEFYDERFLGPHHPDSLVQIYIPLAQ